MLLQLLLSWCCSCCCFLFVVAAVAAAVVAVAAVVAAVAAAVVAVAAAVVAVVEARYVWSPIQVAGGPSIRLSTGSVSRSQDGGEGAVVALRPVCCIPPDANEPKRR